MRSPNAIVGAVLSVVLLHAQQGWAENKVWDVAQLLKANTLVQDGVIVLEDGERKKPVRTDHLRTLLEVHHRLGEVAKSLVSLGIEIDRDPNAEAQFSKARIVVTTGMLDLIGHDANLLAALMGHEYAHMSLKHDFQR